MKPAAILFRDGNIWQNIKTSKRYRTKNTVINTTNDQDGQTMVVYQSVTEDYHGRPLDICVREANEFLEKFKPLDFWED